MHFSVCVWGVEMIDIWFHPPLSKEIIDQGWRWAGCIYTGKHIGFKPELKFTLFDMPASMTACVCYIYVMQPNQWQPAQSRQQPWKWASGSPIGFKPKLKLTQFGMSASMTACVYYVCLLQPNHSDSQHSRDSNSHGAKRPADKRDASHNHQAKKPRRDERHRDGWASH